MTENIPKADQNSAKSDEIELKNHLLNAELSDNDAKTTQNISIDPIIPSFKCPDFVLDFLQDKPVKIQELILTKNLNNDQKKKVRDVFKASDNELKINREACRIMIEKLVAKNPDLAPYFSNEIIFLGTFGFGFMERKQLVEDMVSLDKKQE